MGGAPRGGLIAAAAAAAADGITCMAGSHKTRDSRCRAGRGGEWGVGRSHTDEPREREAIGERGDVNGRPCGRFAGPVHADSHPDSGGGAVSSDLVTQQC